MDELCKSLVTLIIASILTAIPIMLGISLCKHWGDFIQAILTGLVVFEWFILWGVLDLIE